MCEYIDHNMSLVSLQLTSSLINRWLWFPYHGHWTSLITGSHHQENDAMDKIQSKAQHKIMQFICWSFSNVKYHFYEIVQLPDAVGMLWVYQMSQRNWVTIKLHYRYLRKCLLGWHESRLGLVSPSYGVTNLSLDLSQPNRDFRRYLQCTFMVAQLRCDV